jgi:hypothetical protein
MADQCRPPIGRDRGCSLSGTGPLPELQNHRMTRRAEGHPLMPNMAPHAQSPIPYGQRI